MEVKSNESQKSDKSNETKDVFISKETIMRLLKDIKQLKKNPLTDNGIYYEHSGDEILSGKAMIIGPQDTPYENGYYFFKFKFPANYPFEPPIVKFCTCDGKTRFNPNLYINGKVCVSILNTWRGEKWSGCQTISSILLTICSLLNNDPLLNEPGISKLHPDNDPYQKIITYKNIDHAILDSLESSYIHNNFPEFIESMKNSFENNKENIMKRIEQHHMNSKRKITLQTKIYNMNTKIDYNYLKL